jgi:hypothetical protein
MLKKKLFEIGGKYILEARSEYKIKHLKPTGHVTHQPV